MSDGITAGHDGAPRDAGDRAAALMRELESLKTDEPGLADLSERLLSRVYDIGAEFIMLLVVSVVALAIAGATGHIPIDPATQARSPDRPAAIGFDVVLFIALVVYELGPALFGRRSFGKWRTNLTIVDTQGNPATLGQIVRRFLFWFVPLVLVGLAWAATIPSWLSVLCEFLMLGWLGLLFLSMQRDDESRGWHDKFAGTRVIRPR